MKLCGACECHEVTREVCPSCELYNAAVDAQRRAATAIAKSRRPTATDAWINPHGVFAWVGGIAMQVGTAEEAAPFAELTTRARVVNCFWQDPAFVGREG